jgi:serine/threonine protein kinase
VAAPLLSPGDTLGKYEIVRELAIGGMAAIYLARVRGQAGFEKNVVLKVILPNLASDQSLVESFLDEARLAATLRHSNIADVFDVGAEAKRYYFAMEHVHGENARTVRLESKQKSLPIPLEVSLAITIGTTAALGYAHDRSGPDGPLNLIHRDISPSNILVSFEGAIKLVDFGIARASSRSTKTRTGMRRGKVPYMSPEQCRGQPLDRRTDLFSLGTVIYELTCGQRPFLGNSDFEVMDAIVTCKPRPPSAIRPQYPPVLEQIVMRLLALSPAARYQTAHQVLDDIEGFAKSQSLLTSAQVVARYMRALFETAPDLDRDTYTDLGGASGARTREVPSNEPPPYLEDQPTQLSPRKPKVPPRKQAPSTLGVPTVAGISDDGSITSPFAELTSQDLAVPFDPIDARSAEILDQLDHDAPAGETPEARAFRHVETLLDQANGWLAIGEADKAVTALELALDESADSARGQELLQQKIEIIVAVYEGMLEDPYRVPTLARSAAELAAVPMEDAARDLIQWIDGTATVKDIVERSGAQRLEVYHHLCQLLLRGVLH